METQSALCHSMERMKAAIILLMTPVVSTYKDMPIILKWVRVRYFLTCKTIITVSSLQSNLIRSHERSDVMVWCTELQPSIDKHVSSWLMDHQCLLRLDICKQPQCMDDSIRNPTLGELMRNSRMVHLTMYAVGGQWLWVGQSVLMAVRIWVNRSLRMCHWALIKCDMIWHLGCRHQFWGIWNPLIMVILTLGLVGSSWWCHTLYL